MNSIDNLQRDEVWDALYLRIPALIKSNSWTGYSIGATLGLGGGLIAFVLTILLSSISWFLSGDITPTFKEVNFVSLLLVLPLFGFGAHCLDLLEKKHL